MSYLEQYCKALLGVLAAFVVYDFLSQGTPAPVAHLTWEFARASIKVHCTDASWVALGITFLFPAKK